MKPPARPTSHLRSAPVICPNWSWCPSLTKQWFSQRKARDKIRTNGTSSERRMCLEKDPLPTRISKPRACDPKQPVTISAAAGGNADFSPFRGRPTWGGKIVSVQVLTTPFQRLGPALPEVRTHSEISQAHKSVHGHFAQVVWIGFLSFAS